MIDPDDELREFLGIIASTRIEYFDDVDDADKKQLTALYLKSSYGDSAVIIEEIDLCAHIAIILSAETLHEHIVGRDVLSRILVAIATDECKRYVDRVLPGMVSDAKYADDENAAIDRGDALDNALINIGGVLHRFGVI